MIQTALSSPKKLVSPEAAFGSAEGISVISHGDFDTIAPMQKEWDDFIESHDGDIFLTYDWCRIWWKYYGSNRELGLFIIRNGDSLCGIIPLFREIIRIGPVSLRVIKMVSSDYMPVAVNIAIRDKFINQVIAAIVSKIQAHWKWDLIYLGPLSGRYQSVEKLVNAFQRALGESYLCEKTTSDVQTFFTVAPDWDQQVSALGAKQRTNARRTFREIDRRAISISSVRAASDTYIPMFNDFVRMHQAHWRKIGKPGHFGAWRASTSFHREIAGIQLAHDRLRLLEIRFNEQIVGYEYIYRLNGTYFWFLNAREESKDMERVDFKWIAFRTRATCAVEDGVTLIDGMRGKYDYKLAMGGKLLPINNIFVYPINPATRLRVLLFRRAAQWLHIGYYKIWRTRIAPRFGFKLRSLWDKWIRSYLLAG